MQFGINQKQKKNPKKNFFEKSMSADLFQFARENSCDYYYILYNNYIFLFPVN